jgi:hypothetical protein
MTRNRIITAAIAAAALAVIGAGSAIAATSSTATPAASYCVRFGSGVSAAGNVVEFNWDGQACPPGTYAHNIADKDQAAPAPSPSTSTSTPAPDTDNFLPSSVNVGHSHPADPADTSFKITDSGTGVVWTCTFSAPTSTETTAKAYKPVISCTTS